MRRGLVILLLFIIAHTIKSQENVELKWIDSPEQYTAEDSVYYLNFENAQNAENFSLLPQYTTVIPLKGSGYSDMNFDVNLMNQKWEAIPAFVPTNFQGNEVLTNDPVVEHFVGVSRKEYSLDVSVIPLRKRNGIVERLTSFTIQINEKPVARLKSTNNSSVFKNTSVLASGKWVKVSIEKTGFYKLTYSDISGMGLDPKTVKVYGNGGEMLDIYIANYAYDDLEETSVFIEKGSDGIFNSGDYILFYAHGPNKWAWNNTKSEFIHTQNSFSDKAYYFITSDAGATKEVMLKPDTIGSVNDTVTWFTDYAVYEPMIKNLLSSGDDWYGDKMIPGQKFSKQFSFPTILENKQAKVSVAYCARSEVSSSIVSVGVDDANAGQFSIVKASKSLIGTYAYEREFIHTFYPKNKAIDFSILFDNTDRGATGWLNYIRVNVKRPLEISGDELFFRNPDKYQFGYKRRFEITNAAQNISVFDITDRHNIERVNAQLNGSVLSFNDDASGIREYVALNTNGSFPKPKIEGEIENQNLHALENIDMVILSPKEFLGEGMAQDLYELHGNQGLNVLLVTPEEIYNEFSSGQRDITAIRWFLKMLYDRGTDEDNLLKYLLIFGDGTYDNRAQSDNEHNKIMTYQSDESLHQANTFVSDDYYGILDDHEGSLGSNDKVDIGIGRYPVYNIQEAKAMVTKTKYYLQNLNRSMWKNTVCFVADDGDNNTHMYDANRMADKVMQNHPDMIVDKILLDAYQQVIESSGPSYPDANKTLDKNINKGVVLLNYSGHGGVSGLTDEKIITKNIINNFTNLNNLPVWVTATCEFSRFDEFETTAGEYVLLSEQGGGVSLFTTTRVVFSSSNYTINNNFFDFALKYDNEGKPLTLGEICRLTKSKTGTGANKRKFVLLGNPALRMALPTLSVRTKSINGNADFETNNDTISALETVSIEGEVALENGDVASFFNGEVFIKVYDKISSITTLMNDPNDYRSGPMNFKLWDKVIFNGKVEVKNGAFQFQFMVPKEIDYKLGNGRIVYYATYEDFEAKGYTENIKVGGFYDDFRADDLGPDIDMYLNSTGFTNGSTVSSNPLFVANITDQSGINTAGVGIGHDILLVLDDDPMQSYVLNDYYSPVDGFSQGIVKYKFENLSEGEHSLKFRIWDIYNNSSTQTITFYVDNSDSPDVGNVHCYPNPANSYVNFVFEHNRPEAVLDVSIHIYASDGKSINRLDEKLYSVGNRIEPINWDLTDATGRKVNKGLYFYRIVIKTDGRTSSGKAQKLIVN